MHKWRLILIGIVLFIGAGAVFVFLDGKSDSSAPDVGESQGVEAKGRSTPASAVQKPVDAPVVEAAEPTASHTVVQAVEEPADQPQAAEPVVESPPQVPPEVAAAKLDALTNLLPAWMTESGNLLQDHREIDGKNVYRSRSRYAWENGSSMEVEITDAGPEADDAVVKALGFNPQHAESSSEDGFTLAFDEGRVQVNQEYDYNDQGGNMQLLVDGRYLVEIQLQALPLDSFQAILDKQLSFDQLVGKLGK